MIRLGNFEKLDSCSTLVDCSSSLELQSLSKDNPLLASKPASVLPAILYCIWPALCVAVIGSVVCVDIIIIHSNILEINRYYIIYIILITASELVIFDPLTMHTQSQSC